MCSAFSSAVVKPADFRHGDDGSGGLHSDGPVIRGVLVQPEMRSAAVIVVKVRREDAPKMPLVHDDDVIETLPSNRADHALDERILPGTRRCGHHLGDAHARHAALEGRAVNPVAIPVTPAGRRVVRKGLNDLLRSPLGGRMRRGVEMENAPTMVGEHDDDDEEHSSRERRHREEVHRRGRREVIRQEGPRRLRWADG